VTLSQDDTDSQISGNGNGITDENGQATFTVTDPTPETATYQADVGGVTIDQTAQVTFTGPPDQSVQVSPGSGVAGSNFTITEAGFLPGAEASGYCDVLDDGNPESNTLTFTWDPDDVGEADLGDYRVPDTSPQTYPPDDGSFTVPEVEPGTYTIEASCADAGDGDRQDEATTTFTVLPPPAVSADPTSVPDNGFTQSTVTVTVDDADGDPVSGVTVEVSQGPTSSQVSGGGIGVTDAAGQAAFTVTDTTPEVVTYSAEVGGVTLGQTAQVDFTRPPAKSIQASPGSGLAGSTFTISEAGFLLGELANNYCEINFTDPAVLDFTWDPGGSDIDLGHYNVPNIASGTYPPGGQAPFTVPAVAPGVYPIEASCPDAGSSGATRDSALGSFTVLAPLVVPPVVVPPVVPVVVPTVVPTTTTTTTVPKAVAVSPTPTTTTTTAPPVPPAPSPPVHVQPKVLDLEQFTVSPGQKDQATGVGCLANVPVVLTIDGNPVGRTTSTQRGTFVAPLDTSNLSVGQYQVQAHCGPVLDAAFDVVLISQDGQDGSTLVIIIFFLFIALVLFRRRVNVIRQTNS
jgi:hypothetical protein